jgi:hypothetical protein
MTRSLPFDWYDSHVTLFECVALFRDPVEDDDSPDIIKIYYATDPKQRDIRPELTEDDRDSLELAFNEAYDNEALFPDDGDDADDEDEEERD